MVLSIFTLLCFLGADSVDEDIHGGIILFATPALILGIMAIIQKKAGQGMAIAGVVIAGVIVVLLL